MMLLAHREDWPFQGGQGNLEKNDERKDGENGQIDEKYEKNGDSVSLKSAVCKQTASTQTSSRRLPRWFSVAHPKTKSPI